jgi:Tol biopolymer transport system component/tRNA A-37 threonylcarbamoyl transferase component Bud32
VVCPVIPLFHQDGRLAPGDLAVKSVVPDNGVPITVTDAFTRLTVALADRYRIDHELGQGGMATVYLAQDRKHDRKVAIKVLRPELVAVIGAERFLSEIKTTANLQHPHILPLHDSGEADSFLYYVMPYVEGESLRDRLNREKQLPIPDTIRIATEVASALDYAHRHGVIHRDIKPENILLHEGRALVADFGIALAASRAGGARMTETGMSLGTPHYMSPEQAMGEREITARSDVYALGCVTYEMLLGEPPFTGPTAQAIMAKVMTADPVHPSSQRKSVPPAVEVAVLTALEKLPADRFASAGEFAEALRSERPIRSAAQTPVAPVSRRWGWAIGLLALSVAFAAFLAGRRIGREEAPRFPPSQLTINVPTLGGLSAGQLRQIAITPAGDAIVYVGLNEVSNNTLFLQRLDSPSPAPIQGAAGFANPIISRDGRWVIGANLNAGGGSAAIRLPLEGGSPRQLPPQAGSPSGAWSPDGSYWFTEPGIAGVDRLDPSDSLIPLDREKTRGLRIQQILDDGRTALVVHSPSGTNSGPAMLFNLRSAALTPLVEGPVIEIRYAEGELISVLPDGSLTATPFDARSRRVLGPPVQIATGVSLSGTGIAQFAVADNGTIVYIPESPRSLVFINRAGMVRDAIPQRLSFHAPKFSPDGSRLSLDITSADGRDVWILSRDQGTLSRATFARDGHDATWTPDGQHITYTSFLTANTGALGIYRIRPGSTTPAESLIASSHLVYTGAWLRDESALVTAGTDLRSRSNADIALVQNGGHGPIEPLVASPYQELYPAPSPDGRWLAFTSDQSGQQEVYVQPLRGEGDQVQVSQEGGTEPVWGPDGRELFYRSTTGGQVELIAATVRTTPVVTVLARRALFPVSDMLGTPPHSNYDISPDGHTFVMVRRSPATRIVVIQNLPELVRRLRSSTGKSP